ncbi:MAG TPA: hypothetical protein VL996_14815 [Methylocella sp.]|nr:hypothetical protein [Methylocella sp.]
MTWPVVVMWILLFAGLVLPGPLPLLYLFFSLGAFASLNLIPNDSFTLLPQMACAALLVLKILLSRGQLSRAFDAAIDPSRLGLLFAYLAYGLFSSYVMPRFFAHVVEVVPMTAKVPWPVPLVPTGGNINQSALTTLSVGVVLVITLAGENAVFRRHSMLALWIGGIVLFATGIADMTMPESLLEPFRNAYVLLVDVQVYGVKRVVGLTPEASAFGPLCVAAAASLTFLRPCYENVRLRNLFVPLTILGLLTMAALSTSSSAYLGLAAFAMVFVVNWVRRALSSDAPAREGLKWEVAFALFAGLAVLAVVVLMPHALDSTYDLIDGTIFKKMDTTSYVERTGWTTAALHAFFATDGLGVGIGSARTSDWFVSVLSNTGIIGAVFLSCFFLRLFFLRSRSEDSRITEFITGLKFSLLPWFVTMAVSATTSDFGLGTAATLGLLASFAPKSGTTSIKSKAALTRQAQDRGRPGRLSAKGASGSHALTQRPTRR